MPLLEMKSDLSQINTNFGSDTTTAGNTTSFSYDSLGFSTQPNQINFQYNTTPISNYTSGYSIPTPNTTTSTLQALTQEEMDTLGDAEGDAGFAGGIAPVVITLTQPLTTSSPLLPYNPDITPPSKLLNLHKEGREIDLGFTRSALPLESYYAQLTEDKGILGIRNDKVNQVLGFEQPFIVREIGERWGVGMAQRPTGLTDFAKQAITFGVNAIDDLGGAILGREPTVFANRYLADVQRLSKVANPLASIFAIKQDVLHKGIGGKGGNAFETVTTVHYGLEGILNLPDGTSKVTSFGDDSAIDSAANILQDPRIYNPLSIYSVPGLLHINRNGTFDIGALREKVVLTIADYISDQAVELAEDAGRVLIEMGSRFAADMQPLISPIKNAAGRAIKQLRSSKLGKVLDKNTKPVQESLGKFIDDTEDFGREMSKKAKAFGKVLANEYGRMSKATANQLNIDLAGVGVDKVNLIPYGEKGTYGEGKNAQSTEELDFIPFKFKDVVNNKFIVFRAILSGITDTFTPEYASERYVGRPDNVYVYQGTNREIGFTFDVYPKSDQELVVLWDKLNYLAGLTYPTWTGASGGGSGMIAPFSQLTIGQMYTEAPGFISSLTYTVMDEGTWETTFAKLPKYIQVTCTFVYIGNRLPSSTQKHFDVPWVGEKQYKSDLVKILGSTNQPLNEFLNATDAADIISFNF